MWKPGLPHVALCAEYYFNAIIIVLDLETIDIWATSLLLSLLTLFSSNSRKCDFPEMIIVEIVTEIVFSFARHVKTWTISNRSRLLWTLKYKCVNRDIKSFEFLE